MFNFGLFDSNDEKVGTLVGKYAPDGVTLEYVIVHGEPYQIKGEPDVGGADTGTATDASSETDLSVDGSDSGGDLAEDGQEESASPEEE